MDIFDIPQPTQENLLMKWLKVPTVEEGGFEVDTGSAAAELAGLSSENEGLLKITGMHVEEIPEEGNRIFRK
jgi:hypothetical protein